MPASIHQSQIAGNRWDPGQYLAFADHRLRPALELLSRVPPANPQVIYDLGCGTGQVTRMIAERWPAARVYGRDNSPQILQQAAATPGSVTWIQADIADWQPPEAPDLIYSNATLHWVAGHNELFPRLLRLLPPGGLLAVQMPLSWDAPSHRLMRETLANGGPGGRPPGSPKQPHATATAVDAPSHRLMRETLANGGPGGRPLGSDKLHQATATAWVASAADYYDLLADTARSLDIWETEYLQVLEGDDPVLEWVKGTGLRPILNGLADDERDLFLTAYRERLRRAYPRRADGRTLYPFRRLFMIAAM